MAGADIQARVKAGLARAAKKVGDEESKAYLLKKTIKKDPINGDTVTIEEVELVDAISRSFKRHLIDGERIKASDIELVVNGDHVLTEGDEIKMNGGLYTVFLADHKKPKGVMLAQIVGLRGA